MLNCFYSSGSLNQVFLDSLKTAIIYKVWYVEIPLFNQNKQKIKIKL